MYRMAMFMTLQSLIKSAGFVLLSAAELLWVGLNCIVLQLCLKCCHQSRDLQMHQHFFVAFFNLLPMISTIVCSTNRRFLFNGTRNCELRLSFAYAHFCCSLNGLSFSRTISETSVLLRSAYFPKPKACTSALRLVETPKSNCWTDIN